jgi:hypothetical protein
MSDGLTRLLAGLPSAEPSLARTERIRRRCRARLGRQASATSRATPRRSGTVPVWQPLILILGAVYLAEVLVQAVRVYRLP